MRIILFIICVLFLSAESRAQQFIVSETVIDEYALNSINLFRELLSIPNDANNPSDIEKNIQWSEQQFSKRGFTLTRISTSSLPLLLAEREVSGANKTVLIYLQLDGQPVDSSRWMQDNPFQPVLKAENESGEWEIISWDRIDEYNPDWRIFARSASDAKGPVAAFLTAFDLAEYEGIEPNYNIKVIMDFEEELGSPPLPQAVLDNSDLLAADMLIIFDGPSHISGNPTLTFGARGIATIQLTTYGPAVAQHSGHFGNFAPNPAFRLARLLTSMKDDNGLVTIPGYYDGIEISPEVEAVLRAVPDNQEGIKERLQIAETDKVGRFYQEAIQFPSLNVRGMQSGWINDEVRTIIPGWARAEIDVRLVLESDPDRLLNLIKTHIEQQGYLLLDRVPTKEERLTHPKIATFTSNVSYQSFRTPFDSEVGIWLRRAIQTAYNQEPVMIRMSGGSIPISPFVNTLNLPAVTVPTVNRDNNQHSPNENLRLGNYRNAIKTMVYILAEKL
ncbi:MAG: M20/M25/M40 family metallo-hydrolase [bacterium]|nr:M20/M25/M40 family metallo-hydrolase [bacterium]